MKDSRTEMLRYLAAALLLLCLALPVSQCTKKGPPGGAFDAQPAPVVQTLYPSDFMDFGTAGGYLILAAYTWPLLATLARARARKRAALLAVSVLEIASCLASGSLIYVLGTVASSARRLIGGYLAIAALALYLIAVLAEARSRLRGGGKESS